MKGSTTNATTSDRMMRNCGRLYMLTLLLPLLLLLCVCIECSVGAKTTTIVRHTDTIDPQSDGFWTNKTTWNARWVKYWRAKKIYEPVWKKVWTPTIITEWVPLPNAPEPDAWKKPNEHQTHYDED